MRILAVARSTSGHPGSGGMEHGYEDVVNGLKARGHHVAVVTTTGGVPTPGADSAWEVESTTPGKYSRDWWRATADSNAPWLAWGPDLIFSVSRAGAAMTRLGVPLVAQCHGTAWAELRSSWRTPTPRELAKLPLNFGRGLEERRFYQRASRTIAIGDAVAVQLQSAPLYLGTNRVAVIPNGIEPRVWSATGTARSHARRTHSIPADARVGITTSRLHRQKGVDVAVEALAVLPEDNFLLVCGDGPESRRLRNLAVRVGVAHRVRFTGRLQQRELVEAMAAADFLVFPTRREEGLPLGLLQALASGMPVLATAQAQAPPGTERHVVVTKPDAASLAEAWQTLPARGFDSLLPGRYLLDTAIASYDDVLRETWASYPELPKEVPDAAH